MKSPALHLFVCGILVLEPSFSAVCVEKEDAPSQEIMVLPSRALQTFPQDPESFLGAGGENEQARTEEETAFLLDPEESPKSSVMAPVYPRQREILVAKRRLKQPVVSVGVFDERPFYKKHPYVTIFLVTSGIAVLGATPVSAIAVVCALICEPRWAICLMKLSGNHTFNRCSTNQADLVNGTIPSFVMPQPAPLSLTPVLRDSSSSLPHKLNYIWYKGHMQLNFGSRLKARKPNARLLTPPPSTFPQPDFWRKDLMDPRWLSTIHTKSPMRSRLTRPSPTPSTTAVESSSHSPVATNSPQPDYSWIKAIELGWLFRKRVQVTSPTTSTVPSTITIENTTPAATTKRPLPSDFFLKKQPGS